MLLLNIGTDFALPMCWALVLGLTLYFKTPFRSTAPDRRLLTAIFALKLLAGGALWYIYTAYFPYRSTSDSFRYFDDAMHINALSKEHPKIWLQFFFGYKLDQATLQSVYDGLCCWQSSYSYGIANDNPTIIRLNMLIGLVSGGGYGTHVVFHCFLALIGMLALHRGLRKLLPSLFTRQRAVNLAFAGIALFPTVMFWSSSVLKEVPLVFGLGMLILALAGVLHKQWWHLPTLILALLLLFNIKPYVLVTLLPALVAWVIVQRTNWRPALVFPAVLGLAYALAVNAAVVYPPGDLLYILQKKQTDFYNVARANDAGSTVTISPVDQHPIGFLRDLPERLTLTFLRPFPGEVRNALQALAAAENFAFLICFLGVIFYFGRFSRALSGGWSDPNGTAPHRELSLLFWFVVAFALTFGAIAGSTVPVLGALVRYKLPVLLFFGALVGLVLDRILLQVARQRQP